MMRSGPHSFRSMIVHSKCQSSKLIKKRLLVQVSNWVRFFQIFILDFFVEFCESCFKTFVEDEKQKRLNYSNVPIYVHKVMILDDGQPNCDVIKRDSFFPNLIATNFREIKG